MVRRRQLALFALSLAAVSSAPVSRGLRDASVLLPVGDDATSLGAVAEAWPATALSNMSSQLARICAAGIDADERALVHSLVVNLHTEQGSELRLMYGHGVAAQLVKRAQATGKHRMLDAWLSGRAKELSLSSPAAANATAAAELHQREATAELRHAVMSLMYVDAAHEAGLTVAAIHAVKVHMLGFVGWLKKAANSIGQAVSSAVATVGSAVNSVADWSLGAIKALADYTTAAYNAAKSVAKAAYQAVSTAINFIVDAWMDAFGIRGNFDMPKFECSMPFTPRAGCEVTLTITVQQQQGKGGFILATVLPPQAKIVLSPRLDVAVTGECVGAFEVAYEKELKVFQAAVASATLQIGTSFTFESGLSGSVAMSTPIEMKLNGPTAWQQLSSGSIGTPQLNADVGSDAKMTATIYAGMTAKAFEVVYGGAIAEASLTVGGTLTPDGLSGALTAGLVVEGEVGVSVPEITIPDLACGLPGLADVFPPMPSLGASFTLFDTSFDVASGAGGEQPAAVRTEPANTYVPPSSHSYLEAQYFLKDNDDLMLVYTYGTGSGFVEVHCLEAHSLYQRWVSHAILDLPEVPPSETPHLLFSLGPGGSLLIVRAKGTASGKVEVSLRSEASNYANGGGAGGADCVIDAHGSTDPSGCVDNPDMITAWSATGWLGSTSSNPQRFLMANSDGNLGLIRTHGAMIQMEYLLRSEGYSIRRGINTDWPTSITRSKKLIFGHGNGAYPVNLLFLDMGQTDSGTVELSSGGSCFPSLSGCQRYSTQINSADVDRYRDGKTEFVVQKAGDLALVKRADTPNQMLEVHICHYPYSSYRLHAASILPAETPTSMDEATCVREGSLPPRWAPLLRQDARQSGWLLSADTANGWSLAGSGWSSAADDEDGALYLDAGLLGSSSGRGISPFIGADGKYTLRLEWPQGERSGPDQWWPAVWRQASDPSGGACQDWGEAAAGYESIAPASYKCANENGACACGGVGGRVYYGKRYGVGGHPITSLEEMMQSPYAEGAGGDSVACTNAHFGDPLYATSKQCFCARTGFVGLKRSCGPRAPFPLVGDGAARFSTHAHLEVGARAETGGEAVIRGPFGPTVAVALSAKVDKCTSCWRLLMRQDSRPPPGYASKCANEGGTCACAGGVVTFGKRYVNGAPTAGGGTVSWAHKTGGGISCGLCGGCLAPAAAHGCTAYHGQCRWQGLDVAKAACASWSDCKGISYVSGNWYYARGILNSVSSIGQCADGVASRQRWEKAVSAPVASAEISTLDELLISSHATAAGTASFHCGLASFGSDPLHGLHKQCFCSPPRSFFLEADNANGWSLSGTDWSETAEDAPLYMRSPGRHDNDGLGLDSMAGADGKLKFKLTWPGESPSSQVWKQSSTPLGGTCGGKATGFEAIGQIPYGPDNFAGLQRSCGPRGPFPLLMSATGSYTLRPVIGHRSGVLNGPEGDATVAVELWAWDPACGAEAASASAAAEANAVALAAGTAGNPSTALVAGYNAPLLQHDEWNGIEGDYWIKGYHGGYCADKAHGMQCNYGAGQDTIGVTKWRFNHLGGGVFSIKGLYHGKYCADEGNGHHKNIVCDRSGVGSWERFRVLRVPGSSDEVWILGGHGHPLTDPLRNLLACTDHWNHVVCGIWERNERSKWTLEDASA